MNMYDVTVGKSRKSKIWEKVTFTIPEFFDRLNSPSRGTETLDEYMKMTKDERDNLKDVGGFVCGTFDGKQRLKTALTGRCMVTLDFDSVPANTTDDVIRNVEALGFCYCVYSTRKHCAEKPRLRIVLPADRIMTPDEYEPCARRIAEKIGIDMADPTTYDVNRLMYWPSVCADGAFVYKDNREAPCFSVDALLNTYTDWHDIQQWPRSSKKEQAEIHEQKAKQGDPLTKPGIVGQFCRTYNIYEAIAEFLSDEYTPCDNYPERFSYTKGSTDNGAIVYDDGKFLYSHHASDPCSNRLVNAFDLVRLHLFGRLDGSAPDGTPADKLPSYEAMRAFAKGLTPVNETIEAERREEAIEDFKDVVTPKSLSLTCLMDVEEREAEWLIPGYIPRREITIIAGDGGVGKSFAWCALASAVSAGKPCFLLHEHPLYTAQQPQKVMFFSSEDSTEYVLKRRLLDNGADLRNIITLDCGDERFASVRLDSDFLDKLLAEHKPAVCVFDPLQSFLPPRVNMISRSDMRRALGKLHYFGEKHGTTFLLVMHTNKQSTVWGRSRLADSADIWDIARSVLIVGKPAGNGSARYISHEKSNYGPQQPTVLYRIEDNRVVFAGRTEKRDRDYMLEASQMQRSTPAIDDACALIMDCANTEGRCTSPDLFEAGKKNGLSESAIRKAREKLEKEGRLIRKVESAGRGKGTQYYYLPIPTPKYTN